MEPVSVIQHSTGEVIYRNGQPVVSISPENLPYLRLDKGLAFWRIGEQID